jgi:hypothetical protein
MILTLPRLACFAVLALLSAACHNTVYMNYAADTKKFRPVLKAGDVIIWEKPITWVWDDENPCERRRFDASKGTECQIRSDARLSELVYHCDPSSPCDPDIVVDDDYRPFLPPLKLRETIAARDISPDEEVHLRCVNGATEIKEVDEKPAAGQTLQWRSASAHPLPPGWQVELLGESRDKLCEGGKYLWGAGENCVIQKLPAGVTYVEYRVTATGCTTSAAPRITPR